MWNHMTYDGAGYGLMHGGGYWLGMGLHGLFWIGVLVVIAALVMWAVRSAGRPHAGGAVSGTPNPRDILDARYARGEIEEDEYRARRKILES